VPLEHDGRVAEGGRRPGEADKTLRADITGVYGTSQLYQSSTINENDYRLLRAIISFISTEMLM